MYGAFDISTSGLVAQRTWLDTIAGNIANAFTTADANGNPSPYQRRVAVLETDAPDGGPGVHVSEITVDPAPPRMVYDPGHPHAIQSGEFEGYVRYPNVDLGTEMVNAMVAVRAYEANISAIDITKSMMSAAMRIIA